MNPEDRKTCFNCHHDAQVARMECTCDQCKQAFGEAQIAKRQAQGKDNASQAVPDHTQEPQLVQSEAQDAGELLRVLPDQTVEALDPKTDAPESTETPRKRHRR